MYLFKFNNNNLNIQDFIYRFAILCGNNPYLCNVYYVYFNFAKTRTSRIKYQCFRIFCLILSMADFMSNGRSPLHMRQQVNYPERNKFEYKITDKHYVKFAPAPSIGVPWPLPQFYKTQVLSIVSPQFFILFDYTWENFKVRLSERK